MRTGSVTIGPLTHLKNLLKVSVLLFSINLRKTNILLGISVTTLRLEVAKEEAALAESGTNQPHEITPSLLVQTGLELEEQQCVSPNI